MLRILLILLVVAVIAYVFLAPAKSQPVRAVRQSGWLKAGGLLGLLIFISRVFCVPLATLLYYLPFIIPSFRRAAEAGANPAQNSTGAMTRAEAQLILGLSDNADAQAVQEAHRRLITKNHPDKGGSDYLAAKINQARDVLLG